MKQRKKSKPNGHRAIMGDRLHPKRSRDYFPTPPWATRALLECVFPHLACTIDRDSFLSPRSSTVWEPACGQGHMAAVLGEYFGKVTASDKYSYSRNGNDPPYWLNKRDFIEEFVGFYIPLLDRDWIITNPPFQYLSELFVLRALVRARVGVAMFFRSQWLESVGRYERIFKPHPPAIIAQFSERVPLCKGRWNPDGTTATGYCWIVWLKGHSGPTEFMWIPPGQRVKLSRPDDRVRFTARPVLAAPVAASGVASSQPIEAQRECAAQRKLIPAS